VIFFVLVGDITTGFKALLGLDKQLVSWAKIDPCSITILQNLHWYLPSGSLA
jgi:hypothetical protein